MNESKYVRLSTNRLDLIAAVLDHIFAELKSPECLATILDIKVEEGWPPGEYDKKAQEFFRYRLIEDGVKAIGWYGWYAVRRGTTSTPSVLIGAGGYFGPPDKGGEIEIGFSIMPAWQGHGYATEIAEALIQNAFNDNRVQKVIAHAKLMNIASNKVLEKCGMRYVCSDEKTGNNRYEISRNKGT